MELYNNDLEKALLGCLIQDKKQIPAIEAQGGAKLFYFDKHIVIFDAIKKQARAGEVDIVTVAARAKDVPKSYFVDCVASAPTSLLAESYTSQLKEYSLKRELKILCQTALYKIDDPNILEQVGKGLKEILKRADTINQVDIGNLAAELWTEYVEDKKPAYMKTGIVDLDRIIDGIEHTEHIIIAGRPGMGKTGLACDITRNVAKQGKKILFFTMEMNKKALVRRLICAEAGLSIKRYRNRTLTDIDKEKAAAVLDDFLGWKLKIIDRRVTVSEIKAKVMQEEPDLIVVDYLQLMSLDRRGGVTTNDLVGDNVTGLQGIAKDGPAVITLSQLSRASEKEKRQPNLSDLYESGKIEATGDKIIAPYRLDKDSTEAEILVLKQKDGPVGRCDVMFIKESVSFRSIEQHREPPQEYPAVLRGGKQ